MMNTTNNENGKWKMENKNKIFYVSLNIADRKKSAT